MVYEICPLIELSGFEARLKARVPPPMLARDTGLSITVFGLIFLMFRELAYCPDLLFLFPELNL